MESITKYRQSTHTLAAMIDRAYGPDLVPLESDGWVEELGHGWFNVAYRIRLRDGRDVVLKIAPPPGVEVMTYEHGAMGIELASLAMIAEQTTVPVPKVDFADTSRELVDAPYFFMPFVAGDNLGIVKDDLTAEQREGYSEQLGSLNRDLNAIRGPWFGPLAGPGEPTWRAAFTRIMDDVLADGERRGVAIGFAYDEVREVVAENAAALDEVTEPRFIEWDLWDSNVMIRDGKIVCVIDHERALYGDPLMEAGFVATQLPAFGDSTAFMRGYAHGELTETESVRRRLYCLHLVLIMAIETSYRGHTDSAQYDFARGQIDQAMASFGRRAH